MLAIVLDVERDRKALSSTANRFLGTEIRVRDNVIASASQH